jgi:hypothetical protein
MKMARCPIQSFTSIVNDYIKETSNEHLLKQNEKILKNVLLDTSSRLIRLNNVTLFD